MPKNKFEDVIFTAVMAIVMVYGMIVYNVALNTGGTVSGFTFLAAVHELVFMAPIAFVLEFFVVSKLAGMLAFKIMKPTDRYCLLQCGPAYLPDLQGISELFLL